MRLEGSGHLLNWQQAAPAPATELNADAVFNLNQIARELVSNVIRHAQANTVSVTVTASDRLLIMTLADDGVGLLSRNGGNGLRNVEQRISEIGGSIIFEQGPHGGLQVQLTVPLEHPAFAQRSIE